MTTSPQKSENNSVKGEDFGLPEEFFSVIVEIITMYPEIDEALIFGSRALGTFKPASDINIVLKGKNMSSSTNLSVAGLLDEAPRFPYMVDVVNYETVSNQELKKHIDEHGKIIYNKNEIA